MNGDFSLLHPENWQNLESNKKLKRITQSGKVKRVVRKANTTKKPRKKKNKKIEIFRNELNCNFSEWLQPISLAKNNTNLEDFEDIEIK